jgi:hypothetical protein
MTHEKQLQEQSRPSNNEIQLFTLELLQKFLRTEADIVKSLFEVGTLESCQLNSGQQVCMQQIIEMNAGNPILDEIIRTVKQALPARNEKSEKVYKSENNSTLIFDKNNVERARGYRKNDPHLTEAQAMIINAIIAKTCYQMFLDYTTKTIKEITQNEENELFKSSLRIIGNEVQRKLFQSFFSKKPGRLAFEITDQEIAATLDFDVHLQSAIEENKADKKFHEKFSFLVQSVFDSSDNEGIYESAVANIFDELNKKIMEKQEIVKSINEVKEATAAEDARSLDCDEKDDKENRSEAKDKLESAINRKKEITQYLKVLCDVKESIKNLTALEKKSLGNIFVKSLIDMITPEYESSLKSGSLLPLLDKLLSIRKYCSKKSGNTFADILDIIQSARLEGNPLTSENVQTEIINKLNISSPEELSDSVKLEIKYILLKIDLADGGELRELSPSAVDNRVKEASPESAKKERDAAYKHCLEQLMKVSDLNDVKKAIKTWASAALLYQQNKNGEYKSGSEKKSLFQTVKTAKQSLGRALKKGLHASHRHESTSCLEQITSSDGDIGGIQIAAANADCVMNQLRALQQLYKVHNEHDKEIKALVVHFSSQDRGASRRSEGSESSREAMPGSGDPSEADDSKSSSDEGDAMERSPHSRSPSRSSSSLFGTPVFAAAEPADERPLLSAYQKKLEDSRAACFTEVNLTRKTPIFKISDLQLAIKNTQELLDVAEDLGVINALKDSLGRYKKAEELLASLDAKMPKEESISVVRQGSP